MTQKTAGSQSAVDAPQAGEFSRLSPGGYFIALHLGFAFPVAEHNALPSHWVDHYTRSNYMLGDPVMRWLHANEGWLRWSDIPLDDPQGILADAARHGLAHGLAVSHADDAGRRSLATFARADRPFTEDEAKFLAARLAWLHGALVPPPQED